MASPLDVSYARGLGLQIQTPIKRSTLAGMVHEKEQSLPATTKQRAIAQRVGVTVPPEATYFEAQRMLRKEIDERNMLAMRHSALQPGKRVTYSDGQIYKVVRPGRRASGYMVTLEPAEKGRGTMLDLPLYLLLDLKTDMGTPITAKK